MGVQGQTCTENPQYDANKKTYIEHAIDLRTFIAAIGGIGSPD